MDIVGRMRRYLMLTTRTCTAAALLALCAPVLAGFLTKDVPKDIVADPTTEQVEFVVQKPMSDVLQKIRNMRITCGGDRAEEVVEPDSATVISWISKSTVSYIMVLTDRSPATHLRIYMNANVSRQKRGWPLVIDDWFAKDGGTCIGDLLRRS